MHSGLGALLALFGATVLAGWWFQWPAVVRLLPQLPPMVASAALCFAVVGGSLLIQHGGAVRYRGITTLAGSLVGAIAILALAEHAFAADLGIDWPGLHRWLQDANPGRMSSATAAGFLAAGAALVAAARAPGAWSIAVVRGLALAAGVIGVLGLIGHVVSAALLFPGYLFAGMAVHTAAGMVVAAIALQSAFGRPAVWKRVGLFSREDDRITFVGAAVLVGMTLAAGVVVFAVLQSRVQTLVRDELLASHADRATVFRDVIELRESNARIAATRPAAARNLRVIRAGRDDGSNLANLQAVVDSFVKEGFSAIAYADLDGTRVASGGRFSPAPDLAVVLSTPAGAELLWSEGFVLRHRLPVHDAGSKVGEVLAEQPLPILTRLSQRAPGGGDTWDMGICVRDGERLRCFPQRLNPKVFSTDLVNVAGDPLPMTRALSGESGTVITRDYRRQNVVAAYGPIEGIGLGMVLKADTAELFAPIREPLQLAVALLLVFVVIGTLLLRSHVKPLATKVVEANADLERRVKARTAEVERLNTQLEERVALRTAQLEAANKELEAFSYSVSHDLRAPLRHIHGFTELLREENEATLSGEAKRYLGVIRDAVGRMGRLIDDLLAFSRMGQVDLRHEVVEMTALAREAAGEVERGAGGQAIEWRIGALPAVRGDRATLKQVWLNLLANAAKYSRNRSPAIVEVSGAAGPGEAEFRVTDNGAGFDMAYAGKLFGVFQRLHRQAEFEGTGIGLANVRRIVARHGGRTWAEAEPERGARFYFTIPLSRETGR